MPTTNKFSLSTPTCFVGGNARQRLSLSLSLSRAYIIVHHRLAGRHCLLVAASVSLSVSLSIPYLSDCRPAKFDHIYQLAQANCVLFDFYLLRNIQIIAHD